MSGADESGPGAEGSTGAGEEAAAERPFLRVLTPGATPEEVAALVAVLGAMAAGSGEPPTRRRPVWSAPARMHRHAPASGPGAWRASGLPR